MAGDTVSSGRYQLPESIRLKGEENYIAWKDALENLAISNDLQKYIYKKGRALPYIDKFDDKAKTDDLLL